MSQSTSIITVTLNPAIDRTVFIDGFRMSEVNRASRYHRQAGGKGINVATMLSLAGQHCIVSGFLGMDNAQIFESHFENHGLNDHFIRIAGETREGIKLIDEQTQQTTDVNLPGNPPSVENCQALETELLKIVEPETWVAFSGSMPPGLDLNYLGSLISKIRKKGAKVAVDTSGAALRTAIEAGVDLAKPNLEEFEALVGTPMKAIDSITNAAQELREKSGTDLIVSLGEQGALFLTGDGTCCTAAPKVEVVSTVGAGDSMLAGYLYGKAKGSCFNNCARYATVFAWSRLERLEPQLPDGDLLQQRLQEVVVR